MDGRCYIWVNTDLEVEPGENITYWLEEAVTDGYSQLLVLENGNLKSTRFVARQPSDQQLEEFRQFNLSSGSSVINGELCEKVNLSSEVHGLGVLSWFQPLATINAYRSTQPPYALKQIHFIALNLTFNMETNEHGELQAVNDAGDYIAPVQHQIDKWPILATHSRYLLLENAGGGQQVLIPIDSLRAALGSTVLRFLSGITSSPLMEASLNTILNQSVDPQNDRQYYTYTFDAQGMLTSNEPEAILLLLCHHLHELLNVSGSVERVLHYLTTFETLANQMRLPETVLNLCTKIEVGAVLLNNEEFSRFALRLAAIRAKNRLEFSREYNESSSSTIKILSGLRHNGIIADSIAKIPISSQLLKNKNCRL